MKTINVMRLISCAVFAILPIAMLSYNPGVVVAVHESEFGSLVAGVLPLINSFTKNFVIEERIEDPNITITKMEGDLGDVRPDQLQFDFTSVPGSIIVRISKAGQKIKSYADLKMGIFTSSGTIITSGVVDSITLRVNFRDFDAQHKDKPYFTVKIIDIQFDKEAFTIEGDFQGIPQFIIDSVMKIFKAQVIDKMKAIIINKIDRDGDEIIDRILNENYPFALPLLPINTSVCVNLIDKPTIDDKNIYFQLDGTFFNTQTGYNRTRDAEAISMNTDNQFYINTFITQYSIKSILEALVNNPIGFDVLGISMSFDSLDDQTEVTIQDNQLSMTSLKTKFGIKYKSFFIEVISGLDVKANLCVNKENEKLEASIDFSHLSFSEFSLESNFWIPGIASYIISKLIELLIKIKHRYVFGLPAENLPFGIEVKDLGVQLFDKHVRAGLSIEKSIK
jgi:hypothetical protein